MRKQTLKFKAGEPIVIATVEGLIYIHKLDNRTFRFELPDGIKAFKGEARAIANKPTVFSLGAITEEPAADPEEEGED